MRRFREKVISRFVTKSCEFMRFDEYANDYSGVLITPQYVSGDMGGFNTTRIFCQPRRESRWHDGQIP
jgi:hypothetical protein